MRVSVGVARRERRPRPARRCRALHHRPRRRPARPRRRGAHAVVRAAATARAGARWAGVGRRRSGRPRPSRRPTRLAWEQVRLPGLLGGRARRRAPRPALHDARARPPVPRVVTIHDLTFLDHPEWHERSKVIVFRRAIRVAARRADAIVCVSRSHRRAPRRAVRAHRAGCSSCPTASTTTASGPSRPAPSRRRRRGGARRRASCAGSACARPTSCSSARSSRARPSPTSSPPSTAWPDARRAVAGPRRPARLGGRRRRPGHRRPRAARTRIVRTGYVPDDAVPALLRRAAVVAYPALEEGFGLPALEALACGTPLVTTAGTAMAEVAAGAAVLVTPGSVPELADALDEALDGWRRGARHDGASGSRWPPATPGRRAPPGTWPPTAGRRGDPRPRHRAPGAGPR